MGTFPRDSEMVPYKCASIRFAYRGKEVGSYTSGKSHFVDGGAITSKTRPARIKGFLNPHHGAFSGHKGTSPFED